MAVRGLRHRMAGDPRIRSRSPPRRLSPLRRQSRPTPAMGQRPHRPTPARSRCASRPADEGAIRRARRLTPTGVVSATMGIAGRRLREHLARQGVAVIGLAWPASRTVPAGPPLGIPARRVVTLVAEAGVLTGQQPPVAVSQPPRLGGRGVELAAGGPVAGVIGVQQFRGGAQPHRWVAVGDPEGEPLVDQLGERAGALASAGPPSGNPPMDRPVGRAPKLTSRKTTRPGCRDSGSSSSG